MSATFRGTRTLRFLWMYKLASAPYARSASPGSRVGVFIIASPACWAARTALRTALYFIQSATTGFIASIFPSRNRVSLKEAFEGPEPYDGKLSRPVLRGLAPSNGGWPLGDGMFSPPTRLRRPKRFPATLAGPQVYREKAISAVVAILQPQNRSNTKSISNDPDLFT
jgi:hypothetical protein